MRYYLSLTDEHGTLIARWPIESNADHPELEEDDELMGPDDFGALVKREIAVKERQPPGN